MGFFATTIITLTHSDGTVVARNLPVQLDPKNLPWDIQAQQTIPVDVFECETIGWMQPLPIRSDYLVDQATGAKYSMFSTVFKGINTLQFQVSRPSGATP